MKRIHFTAVLFCLMGANLFAQTTGEIIVPLTRNATQAAEFIQRTNLRSIQTFPTDTLTLPTTGLLDNFSLDSHRPDTAMWDYDPNVYTTSNNLGSGVFINRTWAIAPINIGVCTFDGLNCTGEPYNQLALVSSHGPCDELVSRPIDLSAYTPADSIYLSFWYESKGRGYTPNPLDSLNLEFNSPNWQAFAAPLEWKNVWYSEGFAPTDSNFHLVMVKIVDTAYFHKGFRFRFHNWASQCGSNDHWHIDDVYIKSNRTINDTVPGDVAFVYPPSSGLADFWAVPHTHYKPTMMATNYNIQMRNNDVAPRNITYWYYAYDETGAQIYQYPNASGAVYNNFDTYLNSGYGNLPSVTNPGIGFSFPQVAINNDTGTYEVKHVIKQNALQIDTVTTEQKFYNYYAYDDGTAETGYGLLGQYSMLAYKFTLPVGVQDTLKAVQMYFLPVQNIPNLQLENWTLTVWSDQGNQPGTIIYQQRTQTSQYSYETPDRFVTYGIDSGTVVLAGTFYVGWQQEGADRLYIGMDFNTDHHDKVYFNTSGNWNTSIFSGSLMMRPVFGELYDASGIHESTAANHFSLYPNPTNSMVTIAGLTDEQKNCSVSVMDISGREVIAQQLNADGTMDVSSLSPGVYIVQLRNKQGEAFGTQRLVISQ